MPRTVSWSAESPFGCEQFNSALSDEDDWLARLGQYDVGTDILDAPIVEGDGTVTVATTLSVFGDRLPKMVTQLRRGDMKMVRHEKWTPVEGGPVRGQTSTTAPGVPLSVLTEALLTPARDGSRLEYTTTVECQSSFYRRQDREPHRQQGARAYRRDAPLHDGVDQRECLTPAGELAAGGPRRPFASCGAAIPAKTSATRCKQYRGDGN